MGFKIVEDRPVPKNVYNWQVYFIAIMTSFGSVLFGYDTGVCHLKVKLTIVHRGYYRIDGLPGRLWFHWTIDRHHKLLLGQRHLMFPWWLFLQRIHDLPLT
jgi:hypothetical protein